ncbi:ribose 5-phosphate isomerase B [Clostridium formicaceticum]|uniref:Ribose-5-phosphate isomerase B n=1 Tax=Clostridium formicaceticum TaxID=1497 RepID=A0AAC9WHI7_9CLOT|nr:ribose 5-phosphate isomerase B [Clostridium formicaceticum]AOY74630.1 ribose 5-phosphate isomerase B [Clostridium formicaceticum]ARE88996.1 Ribose-5-phosphate isomerase B [Clostridium formicaceticum]
MKIAIGCDEAAYSFKEVIKNYLVSKGHEVEDFGVHDVNPVLYPDIAYAVSKSIVESKNERGVLICGTGIGMNITANKVPGIRSAVCHDPFSTERARKSNNAQVMCMGARVIASELAKTLIDIWLDSEFTGGASTEKVEKIGYYEQKEMKKEAI